jgi:ubiquitin-protein ligase
MWKRTISLIDFIETVINSIDNNHFKHPQNEKCADEYRNNYEKFYETALQYTLKYGRPRH